MTGPCKICGQHEQLNDGICDSCTHLQYNEEIRRDDFWFSLVLAEQEEAKIKKLEIEIEAIEHSLGNWYCWRKEELETELFKKLREYKKLTE